MLARFVQACRNDDRIVAAFLAGSFARGEADQHSDLDLCVVAADGAFEQVVGGRERLTSMLGDVLFLEDFGNQVLVFAILADGTDTELHVVRQRESGRSGRGLIACSWTITACSRA